MAATKQLFVVLSVWVLHLVLVVVVRTEYLVGFSQKTIKVPLSSPRPTRYAAISVKTKAKVVTGMTRSNSSAVSFSASYLGNLNRWSLILEPELNQSLAEKTLCMSPEMEIRSLETNEEEFILAETSTPRQDKDYIYTVVYSRTVNGLDVDVEADWNTMFMIGLNETIQTEVDPYSTKVFQFLPDGDYGKEEELYLVSLDSIRNNEKCMYRVIFNDCLFSFSYQIALILYFWYKIGGKMFVCVLHLMNNDLKSAKIHFSSKLRYVEKMSYFQI